MDLVLTQSLECRLCKQDIHDPVVTHTRLFVKLFGKTRYAVCPCCGQPNVEEQNSKRWQGKVNRYLEKHGEG